MITNTFMIVLGLLLILWLYALIFSDLDHAATTFRGHSLSSQKQFWLGIFLFPFVQFYRLIRWLIRGLKHIIVDVIFEIFLMGFLQLIWFLIRGFFLLLFRIFD